MMWIIKLAWKNLWRNRSRTLITVSAIFFAVILSTIAESLKQGVFENLVKNVVSFYTGYVQVHKKGYQDEQILENSFARNISVENKINRETNVSMFTPRIESFCLASSDELTKGCLVVGISPETENRITLLKDKVIKGDFLTPNDHSVLLAEGLADRLKLVVNDTLILIGQGFQGAIAAGKYPVKGIFRLGSPRLNDKVLYIPLAAAQEFFSAEGRVTSYILSLKNNKGVQLLSEKLGKSLGPGYEVMTWGELLPDIKQHIATDSNNMKVVQSVLYLLICFGIFSTLLMMMMERKYEMGMLVAIGMQKSKMIAMFTCESVLTVFIGCIAGIIASVPLVYYLAKHPIRIGGDTARAYERFGFEAIFPTSTDASIFLWQGFIVLIIGLALSIYPVIKVIRLQPVEAMKK